LEIELHKDFVGNTYRSRDKEAREQVPETQEERHKNCSNLMARSERNKHHPVKCEVHEGSEYEEIEPQEVCKFPGESNHDIEQYTIDHSLDCNINSLNGNLKGTR